MINKRQPTFIQRLSPQGYLPLWFFWASLGIVAVAEYLTAAVSPGIGLTMHAGLLLALIAYGSLHGHELTRRLALGLTIAPLIRLMSLSLPLRIIPQLAWYPIIAVPLLMATWLIARQVGLTAPMLGLRSSRVWLQLMLGGLGFLLGAIEYAILKPQPIVSQASVGMVVLTVVLLTIATGFTEEIIFRGLLQRLALDVLPRTGLIYVTALFAVLHIGYLSIADVVFVFAVGLLFAWIVQWSGSILGVTLAHGTTNVTLFLIMPLLKDPFIATSRPFAGIVLLSTTSALVALLLIRSQARREQLPNDALPIGATSSRKLRKRGGIPRKTLAEKTDRFTLAEIEQENLGIKREEA